MAMSLRDALEPLAPLRGRRVVVSTMASVAVWPQLSDGPFDFAYMPSAMGQGPALGLGLALARPDRGAIVLSGDGSLLMNLGSLATIAACPAPLWIVVLDNGLYEVTGGQPTAGAGRVDFAALARGAGIPRAYAFSDLADWRRRAPEALDGEGPVLISLKIEGRMGQKTPKPPRPMQDQMRRLTEALAANDGAG